MTREGAYHGDTVLGMSMQLVRGGETCPKEGKRKKRGKGKCWGKRKKKKEREGDFRD
jgi:hypothetical protein